MLLFPIGFFYACFMVASKRIAAVAAQGKCSFPWDGIGLAHKRQLRFHRAVCKTAISPERCIIAPFILKGFGRCCMILIIKLDSVIVKEDTRCTLK